MSKVTVYESRTIIPTYDVGTPDKNPMFYEKRVYQGSSGKVYPLPVIDKIYDEKKDKAYNAVFLENEYIKVMILPELGGRIQRAYDKTNGYDFVYYNQVIKPALVGLAGPWISGGIEFNWPQHHRPSTFSPIDHTIEEHDDGSCTVWCNEIDKMYGTKALMGFTLHPKKAYIEITGQVFNPTDIPQTFLWWANPAVAVNDYTKSIFPPDVHAVFDHGKRDVSEFPIAKGEYYKIDYSPGTDISRYKNIPVPTSYMAYHSDYNFVGGYDFKEKAGVLHVANHHISPGKKQWTWGNGDFGQAWDRQLTDEDGPYIELMTGVYTDNQPDFTWLESGEEKRFKQYFLPYKHVGEVKNASKDLLLGLDVSDTITCKLYASSVLKNLEVIIKAEDNILVVETIDLIDPTTPYTITCNKPTIKKSEISVGVSNSNGVLLQYTETSSTELDIPDAAKKSEDPENISTNEELFLTGLHLEQYRHATYQPDPYYLEGLKRDPNDVRINNAYGLLLYRRGLFQESEIYFEKAKQRLLWKNPNPYNGDALYNLGLSYKMQGRLQEAYDVIYKSVWNDAMQAKGYYQLATIQARWNSYDEVLRLVKHSLWKNQKDLRARLLYSVMLRLTDNPKEALQFIEETLSFDPLDYGALYERYKTKNDSDSLDFFTSVLRSEPNSYLELAIRYIDFGCYQDAIDILVLDDTVCKHAMILYYLGYCYNQLGQSAKASEMYNKADQANSDLVFPNKLMSILVLDDAKELLPTLPKAYYYLGNLYYDKRIHSKAIDLWEKSKAIDPSFPTVHRNLGLAYYNKQQDIDKAKSALEKAYQLDTEDARVFYELDQLYKRTNTDHKFRLKFMEQNLDTLLLRDDFTIEYIGVLNSLNYFDKALSILLTRKFHVWEGGEGRVVEQYVFALKNLAFQAIKANQYDNAISYLNRAKTYPDNLGEGKLITAQENDIDYYLGICHECLDKSLSTPYYKRAIVGVSEPTAAMFYNDAKPDSIFYQGLAFKKLNNLTAAKKRFDQMIEYGKDHMDDDVRIDYFAISLPNFLIFEEDLKRRNHVHCHYLQALGYLGNNNLELARKHLKKAQSLDINHQGVRAIQNGFNI